MKVIITEAQLKKVVMEEGLYEALRGQRDPDAIFRKIMGLLLVGALTLHSATMLMKRLYDEKAAVPGVERVAQEKEEQGLIAKLKDAWFKKKNKDAQVADKMETDTKEAVDPKFEEKVAAIKEYMTMAAKNQNYDPKKIQISAEKMVEACNKAGFDLPLLIAQAHLESCFGLTPRARKTNSVFSVGSYDSGKNACTYSTQDDSIEPYINLMKNNYLGQKSVGDILKPGAFVNNQNNRYATDKNYEKKVANIRNKIIAKYPILAA